MTWTYCGFMELSTLSMLKKVNKHVCKKCNAEFRQGEKCWHNDGSNTIWYHKECYEKMLY